jgi:hypothetical protein
MGKYNNILSIAPPKPIVCYDFTNINSYSGTGTTVTDIVKNSNAVLVNSPTYSAFTSGTMYFNGVNNFLITSTSLNSFFPGTSPNKSEATSIFAWVYPMDNGVIISEQGTTPTPNTGWHDSQIEMVAGVLKFGMWNGTGISSVSSSISTPFNNWYYIGMVYNGSALTAYVNGVSAGTVSFNRSAPYNNGQDLYYAIASSDPATNMGDGTYANMHLSRFEVFNYDLTQSQINYNYNATKSRFFLVSSGLTIQLDANSSVSYSGSGTALYDLTGSYTHTLIGATFTNLNGVKCFDCTTGNNRVAVNGTGPTLPTSGYTYITWARLNSSNTSFRTLLYTSAPRYTPITIPNDTNTLGYWDTQFRSSGYDLSSSTQVWVQYAIVGDSSSQTFYINGSQVGNSIAQGVGGNVHWGWGNNDVVTQPFGYVANMYLYNRKLTSLEISQQYNYLAPRFNI